jgi:hypothetical protein
MVLMNIQNPASGYPLVAIVSYYVFITVSNILEQVILMHRNAPPHENA